MSFTNYAGLKDSIAGWLNRTNLTERIPDFVAMAEADINSVLRDRRMIVTVTAPSECGSIALPTDWLEAQDVRMVGAETPLRYLPLSEANAARTQAFSPPRFYTLRGNGLGLLPVPPADEDGAFPEVQLTYYARLPALTGDAETNWLLDQEPEVYLYAALLKAAPFMVDDERVPMWKSLYDNAIARLNLSSKVSLVSGGVLVRGRRGFG
jgi:hypothetical protein